MSKRILVIGFLIFALSMVMVAPSFAAVSAVATNNAGVADKVYVTGLAAGDIVKVYPTPNSTVVVLGKATAKSVGGSAYIAEISVKQLIPTTATGPKTLYVGVTPKLQTTETTPRTSFSVPIETKTLLASVAATTPVIVNNGIGVMDTVYITGFIKGDIVKLYDDTQTVVFAKATASATGTVLLKYKQLTDPVYYTVTRTKPATGASTSESGFSAAFNPPAEVATVIVNATPTVAKEVYPTTPVILNNVGVIDTVYISGLLSGDVVRLYDTNIASAKLLASATASVKGSAYGSVTLKTKFSTANVYFTVTRTKVSSGASFGESAKKAIAVPAEGQTPAPNAGQITVANKKAASDTITVTGLLAGDIVKVYAADEDETVIGKAAVGPSATSAIVTVAQLGALADDVYVTITRAKATASSPTLSESTRVKATYIAEP